MPLQPSRGCVLPIAFVAASLSMIAATPPAVGQRAPEFTLQSVSNRTVRLSELFAKSPVALIVLRGYPGYQCPFCQRQVQDFVQKAQAFADAGMQVVFVYPGPPAQLDNEAADFLKGSTFPESFQMLLDPGFAFTELYGLRWNAPGETAYPATFLIDRQGLVYFQKIAKLHGGRTTAAEMIDLLPKKKPAQQGGI